MADLQTLADAIIKGDQVEATNLTKAALDEGTEAKSVLEEGLIAGMDVVGSRFKKNEIYIPEVLIAARAMKSVYSFANFFTAFRFSPSAVNSSRLMIF